MVTSYIRTVYWNFLYYKKGTASVNSDWMYPYFYSPMLQDLANNDLLFVRGYESYSGMNKFGPIHQLLSALPSASIDIVPYEIKPYFLMTSPLYDLFPKTFINDKEGKQFIKRKGIQEIDHGIAIIPIGDRKRIINIVSQIDFSDERKKLWLPEKVMISIIEKKKTHFINYTDITSNIKTYVDRKTNVAYRNDLQPRRPEQQPKVYHQPSCVTNLQQSQYQKPIYQQKQQVYQQRQQPMYQQKQQVYQQRQPTQQPTYQQRQQPMYQQRQVYQQRQPMQQPTQQPKPIQQYQPVTMGQYQKPEQKRVQAENLPKMIDMMPVIKYIETGKTEQLNAYEKMVQIDWNEPY